MLYFDTSYLVRLYVKDRGWEKVRALAATQNVASCVHAQAEIVSALHRKFREKTFNSRELATLLSEFEHDSLAGAYRWLPLSPAVITRLTRVYAALPVSAALRAADAIHLACAAEADFDAVYSNDVRLLDAAVHFGMDGRNIY